MCVCVCMCARKKKGGGERRVGRRRMYDNGSVLGKDKSFDFSVMNDGWVQGYCIRM